MVESEAMDEERSARVFLAVAISKEQSRALAGLQSEIRRNAPAGLYRFVEADQAHVTLQFLGQRSPDEQALIVRAATAAAEGVTTFDLAFGGLGVFPDERRPNVLWMGLTEGKPELVALAVRVAARLRAEGFVLEERPFVPHLTLARVKARPAPGTINTLLARGASPTCVHRVTSFALMESRSTSAGVRYVALRDFPLETPCTPS